MALIRWDKMTEDERLEKMCQIAREKCIVDGVCLPSRSGSLHHAMNKYGISIDKLLESIEFMGWMGEYIDLSDALKALYEEFELQKKVLDDLANVKTIGEFVATALFDKEGNIKTEGNSLYELRVRPIHIKNVLSGLLHHSDEFLVEFTSDKYENIRELAIKKHTASKQVVYKIFIVIFNFLFRSSANVGIYVPAGLEFADGKFVYDFIEVERKRIRQPVTVYEHCIKIFPKILHYKAMSLIALKESAEVKPEHYGLPLTQAFLDKFCKGYKSLTLKVIRPMLETLKIQGITFAIPLPEHSLSRSMIELPYLSYIRTNGNVSKIDRTFGWYVFETISIMDRWKDANFKTKLYASYGEYLDVKLVDMQAEDFVSIRSKDKNPQWNDIMRKIHEDGMYSEEIMSNEEERIEIEADFKDSVWKLWDGQNMDFSNIDEKYSDAIRHYVKHLNDKKSTTRPFLIKAMLEFFKQVNMPKLSVLNRDEEMAFYMELKKSIKDVATQRRAKAILAQFRNIVGHLVKLDLGLVPLHYKIDYTFKIKPINGKIVTFSEDEQQSIIDFLEKSAQETDRLMSRLELCAVGIQLLSARRISEIVSEKEGIGLKVGAIGRWGMSDEKQLRFFRSKPPMRESMVLFADMIGQRSDPFAKAIPELLPKLCDKALEITSKYRHLLPNDIKEFLFVDAAIKGKLYSKISSNRISKRMKKLFKYLGVDSTKTPHTARHSMATALILAGGTVQDAADALGDETKTISSCYQEYTSRQDTLKLFADKGRTQMVDSLEDSAEFKRLEEDKHRVLLAHEMSPNGCKMAGGSCTETIEGRLNCKSYQMQRGAKSCSGCEYLEVSIVDNKAYWLAEFRATLENMGNTDPNSPAYEFEAQHHRAAEAMVQRIEEKEREAKWGF